MTTNTVEYMRAWRAEHLNYDKEWRKKHPEYWKKYKPDIPYYAQSGEKRIKLSAWSRAHYAAIRQAAIERLGGKCVRCGFSDIRALQVDHINGGGSIINKTRSNLWTFRDVLRLDSESLKSKYQLLCANCNWIKRSENHEFLMPSAFEKEAVS